MTFAFLFKFVFKIKRGKTLKCRPAIRAYKYITTRWRSKEFFSIFTIYYFELNSDHSLSNCRSASGVPAQSRRRSPASHTASPSSESLTSVTSVTSVATAVNKPARGSAVVIPTPAPPAATVLNRIRNLQVRRHGQLMHRT